MLDAYKTFTGLYSPLKGGDSKHTVSYKILDAGEYYSLTQQIRTLKRQLYAEKQEHADDVAEEQRKARMACDIYEKQCQRRVNEWRRHAEDCRARQERAEKLSMKLKRVCENLSGNIISQNILSKDPDCINFFSCFKKEDC